jgi:hypothetical protein
MEIFKFQKLDQNTYNAYVQSYQFNPLPLLPSAWGVTASPGATGESLFIFQKKNNFYLIRCSYQTAREINELLKTQNPSDVLDIIKSHAP